MSYSKQFMSDSKELMQAIIKLIDTLWIMHTPDVSAEKSLKILCQSKTVLTEDDWLKVRKHVLVRLKG